MTLVLQVSKRLLNANRTPLYTILTDTFLPLLAHTEPDKPALPDPDPTSVCNNGKPDNLHHVLIVTHHLLSPTKRKNLLHLAADLNLVGFSKTGHPGILYAIGAPDDLGEWLREVKSWNWLALRVRIAIEPVPAEGDKEGPGPEGKKARGDWTELDKLGEAMEWLGKRGREWILTDAGIGSRGG